MRPRLLPRAPFGSQAQTVGCGTNQMGVQVCRAVLWSRNRPVSEPTFCFGFLPPTVETRGEKTEYHVQYLTAGLMTFAGSAGSVCACCVLQPLDKVTVLTATTPPFEQMVF